MLVRYRTEAWMLIQREDPLGVTFRRMSDGAVVEVAGPAAEAVAETMRAIEEYDDPRSRDLLFDNMAATFALAMQPAK